MIKNKVALIGNPVAHSLSPRIFKLWFSQTSINAHYNLIKVDHDSLHNIVNSMKTNGYKGFNVTIPYKSDIIDQLDNIDHFASQIGAVNCVTINEDNSTTGYNTDADGFINNLLFSHPTWNFKTGPAIVLGAGGAARAIIIALFEAGVSEIILINRSENKALTLAKSLERNIKVVPWDNMRKVLGQGSMLVNTTALGMTGYPNLNIDVRLLPKSSLVYDIVYKPDKTKLINDAIANGNPVVKGFGMLLFQAVPAFKKWFGKDVTLSKQHWSLSL